MGKKVRKVHFAGPDPHGRARTIALANSMILTITA
jgi:hypothetical protein